MIENVSNESLQYVQMSVAEALAELSDIERQVVEVVNRRIAAAESVEALVDFLFEATRDVCSCDRISLAFVEEGGRRLVSHYTRASYEPVLLKKGFSQDLQDSSLSEVIDRGTPRIIDDLEAYLDVHPRSGSTKLLREEGLRSSMTCPLTVEGRNVGVLFRSSRKPHAYDRGQLRLHRVIAERLSQAVEKAYRIEHLVEANNAYTEMLGFVSHELKSPVASLVMTSRMLAEGYYGPLEPKQHDKIGKIIAKGNYLLALVGEYLDLARIEAGQLEVKAVPVSDFVGQVVEPAVEIVRGNITGSRMNLTVTAPDAPVLVECDPNLLKIVMVNLVGNAVKYGREGGEIRVTVATAGPRVTVSVWNEGPGFARSQRSKLFRKFSRLDDPELQKRKGTGVGLYTSWRIVNLHGGRIDAKSQHGEWAEFSVEIPVARPVE